jgi:hypothetical protein
MNSETNTIERRNRTRIEWMRFLAPSDYVLLDKMLFQSNLTHANNGQGFMFHVRTLARETGMATGKVSQICRKWPFIKKSGSTKGMTIQLDYAAFETWIVQQVNNDCSPHEPISKSKNCTVPDGIVHPVNNNNSGQASIDNCFPVPSAAVRVVNSAASTAGKIPIVHPVNNKKSARYVASDKEPMSLPMPNSIKPGPSAARQSAIVKQLNMVGFNFSKDTPMGSQRDGFKFCAIEDTDKIILVTADDIGYLQNPKVQSLCEHFRALQYSIILWTEQDQSIFNVVKEKE